MVHCYNTLFRSIICQAVAYGRFKTKVQTPKRWTLTAGCKYSDLTWELLDFGKLVVEEKWSRLEVQL